MPGSTRGRLLVALVAVLVAAIVLAFALGGVTVGIGVAVIAGLAPVVVYYRYVDAQPVSLHPRRRS